MSGPTGRAAQIAHVLFLDIVGYSRASTSAQGRMLEQLNAAVSASAAFAAAQAAGGVQPIPTGDGMVLLFASDVIAPAQCAVEVCRALEGGSRLPAPSPQPRAESRELGAGSREGRCRSGWASTAGWCSGRSTSPGARTWWARGSTPPSA